MNNPRPIFRTTHPAGGRHRPRRAFTIVTAIFLIGFVGLTLASLTTLFVTQARRTGTIRNHAELRQLMQVGAQIAVTRLNQPNSEFPASIPLPASLAGARLTLTSLSSTPTERVVKVETSYQNLSHMQTLTLTNTNNHWQITTADFEK